MNQDVSEEQKNKRDPLTGDKTQFPTSTGIVGATMATAGALAGGATAMATGAAAGSAAGPIGAAVGALAGAVLGAYMEHKVENNNPPGDQVADLEGGEIPSADRTPRSESEVVLTEPRSKRLSQDSRGALPPT